MPDQGRVAVADSFRRILLQPNSVTISADDVDDQLTLVAGNFIEFVVNEGNDTLQINAASTISASFEGGNVQFVTNFTNSEAATSTTTGAVRVTGGLGVGGAIYASSLQATPIGSSSRASGAFTSLGATGTTTLEGTVNINGADVSTSIIPTGIGTVTINPNTAGTINNMSIGATTRSSGAFTTLGANDATTLTGSISANTGTNNQSYTTTGAGTITISSGTAGSIDNLSIGVTTQAAGSFTTLAASGNTTFNGNNAAISLQPTGTGTVTISPATAGSINNMSIGASTRSSGAFTSLDANSTVGLSPANSNVTISPTGTGTVTVNPATAGTINNMSIGASTRSSGAFTTLTANNLTTITDNTTSTTTATGALTVTGGVGIAENLNVGGTSKLGSALTVNSSSTATTTSTTGTLVVTGGVGISGGLNIGGAALGIQNGGQSYAMYVNVDGQLQFLQNAFAGGTFTGTPILTLDDDGAGATVGAQQLKVTATTTSTTTTSGALIISGGVGIAENLNVGGTATVAGLSTTTSVSLNPSTAGSINNINIGASTRGSGAFTTLDANNTVTLTGAVSSNTGTNNQSYTTTGSGTITINSGTTGSIDNMTVGSTTATTGRFTTITSTVATGTAPLTVSSTTKVDNLQSETASKLHTARTISLTGAVTGSGNFDGSGNLTITTSGGANAVALGVDTTGQYASTIGVSGNGLSATTPNADDGTAYTITSNATNNNTANTIVYRDSNGDFSAGTISAAISASTVSASSTVTLNPVDANLSLAPTGTGTVTINPATAGTINNMSIGATTRAAGNFTTLESNGQTTFTANIAGTNKTTGTLVVTGGIGASGTIRATTLAATASVTGITGSFGSVNAGGWTSITGSTLTQFNTDTVTDIDLLGYLVPASNYTQHLRITVTGLYINDQFSPTIYSRLHKSMVSGVWWNGTNFQLDGPVIEHQVYNTDSTNFPAGSTPTAGKAQLVIGTGTVLLRLTNRTSASTNSVTFWNYKLETMVF